MAALCRLGHAASESLIEAQNLITKIYFPRVLLPLAAVIAALVDLAIAGVVLAAMMAWYGTMPTWSLITLPLFLGMAIVAAVAAGLWLSALNAMYRDFRYAQPFLLRLGVFASPVIYSTAELEGHLPDWALVIYGLNPMAGAIDGFRWALFGVQPPDPLILVPSVLTTAVLFVGGLYFFQRMEGTVIDVI